jgi:tetratricopeptide (TPR) repeat protein
MLLLRTKIEPYCSFTVNLGPQYVDRVFDSLLTKQGVGEVVRMNTPERLECYLEYLHQQAHHCNLRLRYSLIQFYIGHFSQQLAAQAGQEEYGRHLREKAICHYESYLELADDTAESRFYAQWQLALLRDELEYPWSQTESVLLKATSFDPSRGEPLKKLVDHYCQAKVWKTAYSLSRFAMKTYFEKTPVAIRRWFVDFDAYNWRLIHTHLYICYKSTHLQEAKRTYQQLVGYARQYPDEMANTDIRIIHSLEKLFYERMADI